MSGRILLDTNIVIALFAADAVVLAHLDAVDESFISAVVLGELYYGAQKSAQRQRNIARIDAFGRSMSVVPSDEETAKVYGRIKASLHAQGRPIPENDIWIAATAIQKGLTLASRDKQFANVEGLEVVN